MSRVVLAMLVATAGVTSTLHLPRRPTVPSVAREGGPVVDDITPPVSRRAIRRPVPTPAQTSRSRHRSRTLNWRALAYCEATGNPRAVDPSGTYFGLYQFDLATWRSVGGRGNPADASPAEQTFRAELLHAQRGTAPWPVCGSRL